MSPRLCFAAAMICALFGCSRANPTTTSIEGIQQPETFWRPSVELPPNAEVVGIVVGERARAYLVDALSLPETVLDKDVLGRHVVNDLIDEIPITVAHCNRVRCTTAFTGKGRTPLEVRVHGWSEVENSMQLEYSGEVFAQDDAPLRRYPFVFTTWSEWVENHPHSDVYLGEYARFYWRGN